MLPRGWACGAAHGSHQWVGTRAPDPAMAKDPFPIDNADDEMLPANPARRRVARATGCLFVIVVLGFILWFTLENDDPPDERPRLFGAAPELVARQLPRSA
jgi:hypothetical protein